MTTSMKSTGKNTSTLLVPKVTVPKATVMHRVGEISRCRNLSAYSFQDVFLSAPQDRIVTIKLGVPASHIKLLAARMNTSKEFLIDALGLAKATLNRKVRENKKLSQGESERVLGVDYLIGQMENMVKESGTPTGFDAAKWVSQWLNSPLPALGNKKPASYMDTVEGQKLVSNFLAMVQSGAYA
jgi:putative toxin-antitoxin system antitoxin component (TIGR02293 family)